MAEDALKILLANKDKQFVQRIINPHIFPVIGNNDGSVSTHRMAAEVDGDGNWLVFPTIVSDGGGLLQLPDNYSAMKAAQESGEFITFGEDKDAALEFAEGGYKVGTKLAGIPGLLR